MEHQALSEQMTQWLGPAGRRLRRAIERSEQLRLALLNLASAAGGILMLVPAIVLIGAAGGAVFVGHDIAGPFDWFLLESLVALSLLVGFVSFQSYYTRPAPPPGLELAREQAPELFGMLERRLSHFKMRPIDRVILTTEPRLAIDATPSFPFPFLHTYTLSVGVPLMFFLSKGQFRLALAGTVAAARNRVSLRGWGTQSLQDWPYIVKTLEQHPCFSSRLLLRPARWVASIVAGLGDESISALQQEQGRWVLNNADEESAVDLLARQVVAKAFLDNIYWPLVYKTAQRSAEPVFRPFSNLPLLLGRLLEDEQARRWLLRAQTASTARQLRLRDTLADLNIDHLHWTGLPKENAFSAVLDSTKLLQELDMQWQRSVETDWKRRYAMFQADKMRFERLHEGAHKHALHGDSAIRYARLARRFLSPERAAAVCRAIYRNNRNDALLCMICGQELLRLGDPKRGCDALQRAAELDPSLANHAHALMKAQQNAWHDYGEQSAPQAYSA